MARSYGFVSNTLYRATGVNFSTVSRETNGAFRGGRGIFYKF